LSTDSSADHELGRNDQSEWQSLHDSLLVRSAAGLYSQQASADYRTHAGCFLTVLLVTPARAAGERRGVLLQRHPTFVSDGAACATVV
jgi:hypothetical protein